jgi:membrane fusion protein, multidrug efflux system
MKYTVLFSIPFLMISCSRNKPPEVSSGERGESSRQPLAVEVRVMEPREFSRQFAVTGQMEALQDAFISPEINGQIKQIPVKNGQRVARGELLVRLNSEVTEKNIAEVRTNLELATRLFEKQEELWQQNIGSEVQYLEAKNSKESLEARLSTLEQQMELARIRAPFTGIVENILVREGEMAAPGMQLLRLVSLETMRLSARVSEAYMKDVREGDQVEIQFPAYPDEVIHETIDRVGQVIDPATRTFVIEVMLENRNKLLKPNMLSRVLITDFSADSALVVPSVVLKQDFDGTFLFLARADRAEKVYVETGITVQDETMITGGLEPGDRVIVRGYNLATDGTPVRIANL